MNIDNETLKSILVLPGHISAEQFLLAERNATQNKQSIIEVLVEQDLIRDEQLGQLLSDNIKVPFVNLRNEKIDEEVLNMIPEIVARSKEIIVFRQDDKHVYVGMVNPDDLETRHILEKKFDLSVKVFYITQNDFQKTIVRYKKSIVDEVNNIINKYQSTNVTKEEKDELIIRMVDLLMEYGHLSKASDIHLEPYVDKIVARFRIDGVMHRLFDIPVEIYEPILTRIKILSKIRIDEHRSAQDGKFRLKIQDQYIDIRVSIVPVTNGENVVMRILSAQNRQMSLSKLGFWSKDLVKITEAIKDPHGMILVTGPTGSGKTTTIYELLKTINNESIHIATIEDPVEYDIEGVSQIQVDNKTNLTFAKGLRAIVRQDPDVILVGEVRDEETAQIAINSAMTGHLVLSTLHTNDAATTLPRLLDMKVESFLIATTVNIVIGQRLVRKICEKCRYSYEIEENEMDIIKKRTEISNALHKNHQTNIDKILLYKGAGCKICANSGYQGRTGIYEVLVMSEAIKKLVLNNSSSGDIKRAAREEGMTTMLEDGVLKMMNGITTLEEVIRVTSTSV